LSPPKLSLHHEIFAHRVFSFKMQFKAVICLALVAAAGAVKIRNSPDVAARVAEETQQNIQIHDQFASQEEKDVEQEKQVKSNKALSQLQKGIHDPCGGITCGALKCPGGFMEEKVEGHCCPYCVNPNIKLEAVVKGATGTNGGAASTFCAKVWCFPTMCTGTETAATTTNGQCCGVCSN